MTATTFGFTKLVVEDLGAAVAFYRDVFGMRAMHRVSSSEHAYALDEVVMAPGEDASGHRLILVTYQERPCPPAGAAWTGFCVPDMAATLVAVERAGGRIEVPAHDNPAHRVRAAIVADPAGHLIEIIQML